MIEFKVGEDEFRAGKLNAIDQLKLARRIGPAMARSASVELITFMRASREPGFVLGIDDVVKVIPSFMRAVEGLSDEDVEVITLTALSAVAKKDRVTQGWAPVVVRTPDGRMTMAFADLDGSTALQIAYRVLGDNLGNFFSGSGSPLNPAGSVPA